MNETARIEACATGARTLGSKALLERLDTGHAADLGLDPVNILYTPLGELTTATDKARRDAPNISIYDIT